MGNRFGRNQRRKMREQLAIKTADINDYSLRLRRAVEERHRAVATIERVREVLGNHFSALPAEVQKTREIPDYYRQAVQRPMSYTFDSSAALDMALDIIDMMVLQGSVIFDSLRRQTHVEFHSHSGSVGYAFSRDAFRYMDRDTVLHQIARPMAQHLINDPEFKKFTGLK